MLPFFRVAVTCNNYLYTRCWWLGFSILLLDAHQYWWPSVRVFSLRRNESVNVLGGGGGGRQLRAAAHTHTPPLLYPTPSVGTLLGQQHQEEAHQEHTANMRAFSLSLFFPLTGRCSTAGTLLLF